MKIFYEILFLIIFALVMIFGVAGEDIYLAIKEKLNSRKRANKS